MQTDALVNLVTSELDQRKGENIVVLDVKGQTSVTDFMILVTGTSTRHIKSLADYVTEKIAEFNLQPLGVEGGLGADWVLLDLGDVIVQIMTAQARQLYQLEKLWSMDTRAKEFTNPQSTVHL